MLFITHLIVNERKCNQRLLSTLHGTEETAESRANTTTDGARTSCPSPWAQGKRESRRYDECHVHESTAAPGSLAAKAWKLGYSNSSKCPIFWVIRLMLDEDTAHAFLLKMERRKGDRTQVGEEAAGADLPVCVSLSLL